MKRIFFFLMFVICTNYIAQNGDSLRGGYGPNRSFWDLKYYTLEVAFHPETKTIEGSNEFLFSVLTLGSESGKNNNKGLQFDLQSPLLVDSVFLNDLKVDLPDILHETNAYFVPYELTGDPRFQRLKVYYHGKPKEAIKPPWDGGVIWAKDSLSKPWISIACQGLGASVWFPCKDSQVDEPDLGVKMTYHVPKGLKCISNGKMTFANFSNKKYDTFSWEVVNPINNYCMIPYIGDYVSIHNHCPTDGEKNLELDYWILRGHEKLAEKQFQEVPRVIRGLESWFGPYPFYEDGFQLIEAPHLGMEHQSAIAYGNQFSNGYLGKDLSGTGVGLLWDFIIVHEMGHEWFGNSITAKDVADMWIHESFTAYSETLFTEFYFGKEKANTYVRGTRNNILNDIPIIGKYGIQLEGSGDMYYKGANMLHTLRACVQNDSLFRACLLKMNKTYWHKTVTSIEIEQFMANELNMKLDLFFDQYLRTTIIPTLEIQHTKKGFKYRWKNTVKGFNMPIIFNGKKFACTTKFKKVKTEQNLEINSNLYILINEK